ncbi:MAG: 1-acyl-sn-glycerol-3-phosphate acyltransferase [Deltaproteobacteria bacterium]|nr:1-acyl-sn-glycerol-3-phosphate acyltransferase [Deltaproteobacteria bacterium]
MSKLNPRSLVALPAVYTVTPAAAIAAIVGELTAGGDSADRIARVWARVVAASMGMELEIVGTERVAPSRSYVVVSNHQSHLDTIALVLSSPVPLRMLAKKSLFYIPVFGQAMRVVGHIPIDRQKGKTDFAALARHCERLRARGRSIMVFPEGTRRDDGTLHEFKSGAFRIATTLGLPVVPVAIRGTGAVLPPHSLAVTPGHVRIEWLDPIPSVGADPDELMATVYEVIARSLS